MLQSRLRLLWVPDFALERQSACTTASALPLHHLSARTDGPQARQRAPLQHLMQQKIASLQRRTLEIFILRQERVMSDIYIYVKKKKTWHVFCGLRAQRGFAKNSSELEILCRISTGKQT